MAEDTRKILCPYCGALNDAQQSRCSECRGLFEPLSRRATQISMGPWYIRDKRHPFRPGCSYETLKKQIEAGRVKPTTVLRGPTTHQFWSLAMNTPGVAHLVGYCHACGAHVTPGAARCPQCSERFKADESRNELGLAYRTKTEAQLAQQALDKEVEQMASGQSAPSDTRDETGDFKPASMSSYVQRQNREQTSPPESSRKPTTPFLPGADLLDEVLGEAPVSDDKPTEKTRTVQFSTKREPAAEAAPAAPAAAPPPPPSAEPAAVTTPDTDTAELPSKGKPINMPMVALIVMNIILIIVVIAALMMTMSPSNGSQSSSPSDTSTFPEDNFGVDPRDDSPPPRTGDNTRTPPTNTDGPDIDEAVPDEAGDSDQASEPAAGSDAPSTDAAPPRNTTTSANRSGSRSGSSSARDYQDPPDVSRPVKPVEKMHTRYPEVEKLVRNKRYEQAVNRFRGILNTIPMGQRTSDHDQYMRYLEQLVAREQAVRFFEVN